MNRILVYGMTDNPGGIETYLMNEFSLLDCSKAIFDFVVDFPSMCYSETVQEKGSKIFFIPAKSKGLFAQWRAFYKLLKEHPEYKKVYFNILDAGAALTMLIPWLLRREIIVHSHNNDTDKRRLHRLCRPFLCLFTKKYCACSQSAATYMFDKKASRALIVPNAIDCKKYAFNSQLRTQKRCELELSPEQFVICHVGRLSRQKNVERLLEIFREIIKTEKNVVLLSVGDGEDREKIKNYAAELGVSPLVRFLGRRSDVAQIMQAADVFVLPSLYEGLGIVAVEAQAAGLPCVLSAQIPQEVAMEKQVEFVSLDAPDEVWKKAIMSYKGAPRAASCLELEKAGYDLNKPGAAQRELTAYFES